MGVPHVVISLEVRMRRWDFFAIFDRSPHRGDGDPNYGYMVGSAHMCLQTFKEYSQEAHQLPPLLIWSIMGFLFTSLHYALKGESGGGWGPTHQRAWVQFPPHGRYFHTLGVYLRIVLLTQWHLWGHFLSRRER